VYDSQGRVAHVVAVAHDVTERGGRTKLCARARCNCRKRRSSPISEAGNGTCGRIRADGRTSSQNLRPPTRSVAVDFRRLLPSRPSGGRERTAKIANEALRSGTDYENQFRIVRPDGTIRTVHNQARVDRDESGRPVRVTAVFQDITERKLAEEQVARARAFRMMVENVRDYAIYILDMNG